MWTVCTLTYRVHILWVCSDITQHIYNVKQQAYVSCNHAPLNVSPMPITLHLDDISSKNMLHKIILITTPVVKCYTNFISTTLMRWLTNMKGILPLKCYRYSIIPYWLGSRWGAFTCVGWQVILCDPIWQVMPRSSRTSSRRGLYSTLTLTFIYFEPVNLRIGEM